MNYSIRLSSKAQKFLDRLNKKMSLRIIEKMEKIKENPFHYLEHYEGEGYKLRIGNCRALIDVDFENKILLVRILDKRGRIYKS